MLQDYVRICEIADHVGKSVKLKGWVYNLRSSGKIRFIILRDGTGYLQCIAFKGEASDEVFETASQATQECAVEIQGRIKEDKRSEGGFECTIEDIEIISTAENYPIGKKDHGVDFLMGERHLWFRSKRTHAILRVRNEVIKSIRDFFYERNFTLIDSPILTPAACEGTTTLFKTDYFDLETAYLTQSGQLYLEPACQAFGNVYCFGPTFRAEKSKTRRHLTEFWMVEPEMAFADLEDDMKLAEDFIVYIVERCLERCGENFKHLERDTAPLENIKTPFPRLHYNDAVKLLKDKGVAIEWGDDFGSPQETAIAEAYDRPVMVHRYPTAIKSFYMDPDPDDPKHALAMDMLAPEGYGEIIGGSQRISDLALLEKRIEEHGLPRKAFEWYLDVRRYGSIPHAGFGLGVERTVSWICGIEHVRESIPYPRTINRIYP